MEIPNQISPIAPLPPTFQEPPKKSKQNIKLIALVIAGLLIAGIAAFIFIKNQQNLGTENNRVLNDQDLKTALAMAQCQHVENETAKNQCYSTWVNNSSSGDIAICDLITQNSEKGYCYLLVAAKNNDRAICDKITNSTINKFSCYERTTGEKQIPTQEDYINACNEIADKEGQENCYAEIAIQLKDLSICNKIVFNQGKKDLCIAEIAFTKQDSKLCLEINDKKLQQECTTAITNPIQN